MARILLNQSTLRSKVFLLFYQSILHSKVIPPPGTIFDVTHKAEVYGRGRSYNIFAGKDGSRGLGKSSLKLEDAVADYSDLDEKDKKVLDDWYSFFQ